MQGTPWVVVEADDKQTIQREFSQGEIVDQFPSKQHAVFLVQTPKVPSMPNTVLQGPIYGEHLPGRAESAHARQASR